MSDIRFGVFDHVVEKEMETDSKVMVLMLKGLRLKRYAFTINARLTDGLKKTA